MAKSLTKTLERIRKNVKIKNCDICRDAIEQINDAIDKGQMITIDLAPDRNCCGHITHWHISAIRRG